MPSDVKPEAPAGAQLSLAGMRLGLRRVSVLVPGIVVFSVAFGAAAAAKGLSLLERACEAELWSACYGLGAVYGVGDVLPADPAKAKRYYKLACDHGVESGCEDLETLRESKTP